ncbi:MAG: nuclear transport factor 2 family protein [Acidimicrobiia bacterium]
MDVVVVASTYLDALVSRDADSALLAPSVRRTNNGVLAVEGADAIREIIRHEPLTDMGGRRWVVDGEHAIAFYDLEATVGAEIWPAYVAEHFVVRDGLIQELDIVFVGDPAKRSRPERPVRYPDGNDARDVVLGIAQAYVAALQSHDASEVPLAERAYRIENGVYMGSTGAEIRAALEDGGMSIISRIEDLHWYAGAGSAAAYYTLFVDAGDAGTVVCKIGERFRVYEGELVEIEVVYSTEIVA